jgi:hypothetical protein
MTSLHPSNANAVHRELALTGKYFNTGKVLIGVSYQPRRKTLSLEEERIQSAILGDTMSRAPRSTVHGWMFLAVVVVLLLGAFVVRSI